MCTYHEVPRLVSLVAGETAEDNRLGRPFTL
jgi:hypothetical protein